MGCNSGVVVVGTVGQYSASCNGSVTYSYGSSCNSATVYGSCNSSVMSSMGSSSCNSSYAGSYTNSCSNSNTEVVPQVTEIDMLFDTVESSVDYVKQLLESGMAQEEAIKILNDRTEDAVEKLEQSKDQLTSEETKQLDEMLDEIADIKAVTDVMDTKDAVDTVASCGTVKENSDVVVKAEVDVQVLELLPAEDVIDIDLLDEVIEEANVPTESISSIIMSLENISEELVQKDDEYTMAEDEVVDLGALFEELEDISDFVDAI